MLKVLIAEDEDIIRKGLAYTVDWLFLDCTIVAEAADGLEGLDMIGRYEPDIVIADIRMPKMDGIDMIRIAKQEHEFESIILTGYSEFEYAREAIQLEVYDYLLKPVDENILSQTIKKLKNRIEEKNTYKNFSKIVKSKKEYILIDPEIYAGENTNQYVIETLKHITDKYNEKLSIESIANELGISVSYLSRKFKEITSQTFLEALYKYRIQKAVELLNTGKYKVYEVSYMVGFNDYKQFHGVFKKYVGISPTEFVKGNILGCNKASHDCKSGIGTRTMT